MASSNIRYGEGVSREIGMVTEHHPRLHLAMFFLTIGGANVLTLMSPCRYSELKYAMLAKIANLVLANS